LGRAVAVVGLALPQQAVSILAVDGQTFGLAKALYGAVRQDSRSLVPVHPEPFHAIDDDPDGLVRGSRLVRVLDPENELSALMAREKPVEQGRADASDMEGAGGARGEADSNRNGGTHHAFSSLYETVIVLQVGIIANYRVNRKQICRS